MFVCTTHNCPETSLASRKQIPWKTAPEIFISFRVPWSHKAPNRIGTFFAGFVKTALISTHKQRVWRGISVPLIVVWSVLTTLLAPCAQYRFINTCWLASRKIIHEFSITKILHKSRSYWVSLISAKKFSVISQVLNFTNLSTAFRRFRLHISKKTPFRKTKQEREKKTEGTGWSWYLRKAL